MSEGMNQPKLKPNTVYVRPREGGGGFDIVWLEGKTTRRVFRRNERVAEEYAERLQAKLNRHEEEPVNYPFADDVSSMDGSMGLPWVLGLWSAFLQVAANPPPGPRGLLEAARVGAMLAASARRFIPADQLRGEAGGEDPNDEKFWAQLAGEAKPWFVKKGVPEPLQKVVLQVLAGGKLMPETFTETETRALLTLLAGGKTA